MSYSYKITGAKKGKVIATNTDFIDVSYDILDEDGTKVADFKDGFSIDTEEIAIRECLQKKVDGYVADLVNKVVEKEQMEKNEGAEKTISGLLSD